MTAWNKGKFKYSDDDIFRKNADISQQRLRIYYYSKNFPYKCSICGIHKWENRALNLELDHKNGDNHDNRIENLRWLCPNCHSLTPTYKAKNFKIKKIDDDKIIETIKYSYNVRQVLIKVGLRARGENYNRIYRLIVKYKLSFLQKKEYFCIDCGIKINKKCKRCSICSHISNRKVKQRPSKEHLLKEIEETNYCIVGRKYGVSDNAIRKWLR